jgi:DNA-binding CsgD family transcriptional regulator
MVLEEGHGRRRAIAPRTHCEFALMAFQPDDLDWWLTQVGPSRISYLFRPDSALILITVYMLCHALQRMGKEVEENLPELECPRCSQSRGLSIAQRLVAEHLLSGCSDAETARALNCSEQTVRQHLRSIFRRLEIPDRERFTPRLKLALILHEWRNILGIRCETCEHLERQTPGQAQIFGTEWNRIEGDGACK